MENPSLTPAGFWVRFVATFVDAMILGLMCMPFSLVAQYFFGPGLGAENASELSARQLGAWFLAVCLASLFGMVIQFAYYAIFYKAKGATPGKQLMGIQVVKQGTGAFLTPSETFLRECVGKVLSGLTFGIGYLMAGLRSDKLALHDLVAGSRVVLKPTTPASVPAAPAPADAAPPAL
jgi:uncharacterized RDD family membrane protein YckC